MANKVKASVKALGSTSKRSKQKVVTEEDDTETESQLKGARTAVSSAEGSALHRIERQTANIHFTMQNQTDKVDYCLKRDKRHIKKWAVMDMEEEPANKEAFIQNQAEGLGQDLDIMPSPMVVEQEDRGDEDKEICKEVEGPYKENKEGHKVDNDETMKKPEVEEL
ncbi:hypothetical protein M422DRAFT_253431 [Sphaerobolus stellatus SS14]|uniref:Uncharacterized protein n=1 Tax=Sphaerobolus stellatus (strain SS14) TaxID=990650 RepID=A0A0C9VMV0_SPHS4|nr:hypothetical protein M422DRAFT_253431 [Sphaerobolus stellatus SS14]